MQVILFLIFAHIIADWALQPEFMANNKGKYWFVMVAHCLVWTGCLCFVLEYFNLFAWWKPLFLFYFHISMDTIKCVVYGKRKPFNFWEHPGDFKLMYIDQSVHLAQCIMVGIFNG